MVNISRNFHPSGHGHGRGRRCRVVGSSANGTEHPLCKTLMHVKSGSAVEAIIFAPDESGVKTSWKSGGGTDAGKAVGRAGGINANKSIGIGETFGVIDHFSALVLLSVCSRDSRVPF
ncbi:hypothetical protein TNCV_921411 [Trichonephila clavipes]|nr:hypothetical protein TNCV_921411 [Trichonephila clavipes]